MEPTLKVARKYPNVKFEHATGFKRAPNLATYAAKFHEGRYIIGQIAGKMSKSGVIGYVAAFPIPEVVAGINSYFLGAQSVNPNIKIKVVWANTWFDPAKPMRQGAPRPGRGHARAAHRQPAPIQQAEAAAASARPPTWNASLQRPSSRPSSTTGPTTMWPAKAVLDGTWKSEDTWGGLKEKMVIMAPYKNMPDDLKKMAEGTEAAIRDGKLNPFKCPVVKQDGTTVECKGSGALLRRTGPRHELLRQGHRRQAASAHRAEKWTRFSAHRRCAACKGEHRMDPKWIPLLGPML